MEGTEVKWLPHLKNAVPVTGYGKKLSMYTIALEGWRRGLKLKFYTIDNPENKLKIRYSLSSEDKEHRFESSKGDKITDLAYEICDDKYLTKEYLSKAGVPIPKGKSFSEDVEDKEIIDYANELGFPLVLKPINANGGKGVFSNIHSLDAFKDALNYVRYELDYLEVMVETYVAGNEYRVVVVDNKVVGALNRVPANVIGNGVDTIRELVRNKNNERKANPHLKSRNIKIDKTVIDLLHSNNYTLKSVPKEGEVVPLRLTSNLSTGGDSVDLTDVLSPELKQIAIDGTNAIPGLTVSGMDMIVNSENDSGVIIEANTKPGLGGHLFPVQGKPRDLPKEIVDYYFPETKDIDRSDLYFDFNSILEPLENRTATTVEVSSLPVGKVYAKKYIISGKVQNVGYKVWIKRQALLSRMHGFAEDLGNGDISVVVASTDEKEVSEFKSICLEGNKKSQVTEVVEQDWHSPIKIGFEINRSLTIEEVKQIEKEKEEIEKERDFFRKRYSQIKGSRLWRYTSPLRNVLDIVKRFIRSK
ncbi:D-alanine-D-alanine ligase-like ATP-grasp enzyme/acylphosphatase [Virgibacillus natechei]|uniref:Acylphosphatase n=1 Tax=Virgibacillus natechei TaxID=1216297 RepID=A0ABS4IKL5_9BACI|nr:acylphosphatase [Virgibacillus natechei]MBP1971476.1 D-alanine-D-alanine ligase-like ATP-grasp enzyme/acylphosphatase [Virgibacillus natechei]UZD12530.1 acylphosphatase [Virgibacillus natechei]